MARFWSRFADPWAALVAAGAGGMAWAVLPGSALAVPLGIGVAAVVFGAKVVGDALLARSGADEAPSRTKLPEPPHGSAARTFLDRVERGLGMLDETVASAASSATREQVRTVAETAASTRTATRGLSGQATAFEQAMHRIPARDLVAERARLAAAVAQATREEVRAEYRTALDGVEQQLAAYSRLAAARETVLARMEAAAVGVEALHARAVELIALAGASGHPADDGMLDELAGELDALRGGLAEAERLTTGTLDPTRPETA